MIKKIFCSRYALQARAIRTGLTHCAKECRYARYYKAHVLRSASRMSLLYKHK